MLKHQGFHVLEFHRIQTQARSCRITGTARSSLANPAEKILKLFSRHEKIALLGVQCYNNEDLMTLYGYLMEPAFRHGCTLLISTDFTLEKKAQKITDLDPHWRYQWTVERIKYLLDQGSSPRRIPVPVSVSWWRHFGNKLSRPRNAAPTQPETARMDPQQKAAVQAGDGVVQVIAPAGSGKTTVLIQRVRELLRRGTPARKILCMSFNRDATVEIRQRLMKAGVEGVVVRSFHGMGLAILKTENRLRQNIGGLGEIQLDQIINQVISDHSTSSGPPISATEARNIISNYKLSAMISSSEALKQASDPGQQLAAELFHRYEQKLRRLNLLDFDDLVANSVSLLQSNREVRHRWQNQFHRLLVDEYQDIEPSQALLVGILAAPQDSLFCVGDEDQCIYAWRRATVQRIIELDQVYPGLERHALTRNYRCGKCITNASRKLIRHNKVRFNKPLLAGAKIKGKIVVASFATRAAGAATAARLIHEADPQKIVLLARTSRLLEEVKSASARLFTSESPVELATIHAAKGREWDRVIIYGADEGQTPHGKGQDEDSIEDERRLFYVAMTRAKWRLEIICTKGRESRFLREAGLR